MSNGVGLIYPPFESEKINRLGIGDGTPKNTQDHTREGGKH